MNNPIGPSLDDIKIEVDRQKKLSKLAGKSVYYLDGDTLIEERPDGSKFASSGPDSLPCVRKLPSPKRV